MIPQSFEYSAADAAVSVAGVNRVARARDLNGMGDLKQEAHFAHLIRVLNAQGRFQEARLRILPEMERRGLRINPVHYTSLFSGAAMDKDPHAAERVRDGLVGWI